MDEQPSQANLADLFTESSFAQFLADGVGETSDQMITRLASVVDANFFSMMEDNVAAFKRLMTYYRCAMMEVETKFRVLDAEFKLRHDRNPIDSIQTRLKSVESLADKMIRRNYPLIMESMEKNINDIAGVRVVCAFPEDIFSLAESLLAQDDVRLIKRSDYVRNPKPNGYRSLHLIVETPIFLEHEKRLMKVEVQLRTISMNFWAALEHQLRYKKDFDPKETKEIGAELAELAEAAAHLDNRMQAIRNQLEGKE